MRSPFALGDVKYSRAESSAAALEAPGHDEAPQRSPMAPLISPFSSSPLLRELPSHHLWIKSCRTFSVLRFTVCKHTFTLHKYSLMSSTVNSNTMQPFTHNQSSNPLTPAELHIFICRWCDFSTTSEIANRGLPSFCLCTNKQLQKASVIYIAINKRFQKFPL